MPEGEEFLNRREASLGSFNIVPVFVKEIILDFLFFIVWWYTIGLRRVLIGLFNEFLKTLRRLSLKIFFKNLFKPLYGDYTKMGRAIGITIRLILFVALILTAFIWLVLLVIIFLGWLLAPPVFLYFFLRQFI